MNTDKENNELDELLSSMPKFTDHRSKEEVYNRLMQDIAADEKIEKQGKLKRASKWMPIVASIASVLLLTFLVSQYMNNSEKASNELMDSTPESKHASQDHEQRIMTGEQQEEDAETLENDSEISMLGFNEPTLHIYKQNNMDAVYEEDLKGGTPFHFSFVENALSVPVTIVIPKEQIDADFPGMEPSSLDLYQRYAERIDEEAMAFMDYHPYKGYFLAEGDTLVHYLPADHGYDIASGTSFPYWNSINEIFVDFQQLKRVNEDGSPLVWDQVGTLEEPESLKGRYNRQNYFIYKAANGEEYLAPTGNHMFKTAKQAFLEMKDPQSDLYKTAIPAGVSFTYNEDKTGATITFEDPLDLTKLDEKQSTQLIEALSLTAASFGLELKLENVVQETWQDYNFTEILPTPIGPNGYIMES